MPWSAGPQANPRTEQKKKSGRKMGPTMSLAVMMLLPWAVFCGALLLFSLRYHHEAPEVWLWVGIGAFAALLTAVSDPSGEGGGWHTYLGTLILCGLAAGSVVGLYNYQAHTFRYWAMDEYRHYTNVLPSEPARSHLDAGVIRFAAEARVDTTKTVGFKAGSVYCVAPIIDDSGAGTPIEYWAAGQDCCTKRSKFACDDVWDSYAKSGVVIREAGGLVPSELHFYMKAIREAGAAYDLVSGRKPLFVTWVTDPGARRMAFWEQSQHLILVASLVYLATSLIFGGAMNYASKKRR